MSLDSLDDKTRRQLRQLIETIAELQQEQQREWISWSDIARCQEGSVELAPMLSALAGLPEAKPYCNLAKNGRVVSLTSAARYLLEFEKAAPISQPEAIAKVIKGYAGGLKKLCFTVNAIMAIGQTEHRFIHTVHAELGDALLPNEAPVNILSQSSGARIHGRIVGQDADENILYLALDHKCYPTLLPALLFVDRAFLLYQLAESLSQLDEIPPLGRAILQPDPEITVRIAHEDSRKTADMLAMLTSPWTRFLWGPPGAGKTFALAQLSRQLIERHPQERILLVAPSNVAVDVAMLKFIAQLESSANQALIANRAILRYGYPRKAEILNRSEILGSVAEEELSQAIGQKQQELGRAAHASLSEERQAILRAELLELQEELKKLVLDHVQRCQVVMTTTAQAYSPNSPITAQKWDTVLVDEVTMVPPAICLYLSSLATQRLLMAGDPRQLGPIYESGRKNRPDAERWMGRDVYDFTRLARGSDENRQVNVDDGRLVRITSQRRCTEDIWQPIGRLYTGVKSLVNEQDRESWRQAQPLAGQGLVVVDVGNGQAGSKCEKIYQSWQNEYTAKVAVDIAQHILNQMSVEPDEKPVAIITPYRAQYRLLKKRLKKLGLQWQVDAGTIHQFQGSEAKAVIFDMVDGPGRQSIGLLLRGDTGLRLVNVAISRAESKFVLLADKTWCRTSMRRTDNSILWDVLVNSPTITVTEATTLVSGPAHPIDAIQPSGAVTSTSITGLEEESPAAVDNVISADWINQLAVGSVVQIPDRDFKRTLNSVLAALHLESHYDAAQHVTTWTGTDRKFRVEHKVKRFVRER